MGVLFKTGMQIMIYCSYPNEEWVQFSHALDGSGGVEFKYMVLMENVKQLRK